MNLEKRGYMNRILTVNLTQEKFVEQRLDERVVYRLLGGKGLAIWLLYRMLKPGVNPLDPENILALATGPLNGTIAPCQKLCVASKSPATGTINDSYMGGGLGAELKFSGYDAMVITGRAEHPSMLIVDNGDVSVKRCESLWGMSTSAAERKVLEELGGDFKVAVIGPAGERMSPIAPVFSNLRSAGRGGLGAVMGSKNLKAIAMRGSKGVKVHDESMFERMVWIALRTLRMNEVTV
ncbi:MAG: aldehyde ferredoxin oxidoreductase N-terminal domain-containing protein, partial [Thermoproteota archaeon]